jgi:hypothetical protein
LSPYQEWLDKALLELEAMAAWDAGVPALAAELVMAAVPRAFNLCDGAFRIRTTRVSALAICVSVMDISLEHHGSQAVQVLDALGLRTGEDVGKVFRALTTTGLVTLDKDEPVGQFEQAPPMAQIYAASESKGGRRSGRKLLSVVKSAVK